MVRTVTTGPEKSGMRKSDKYIPWYFVGFFVVLFILDGIFVYLATSSHTGVVEKGSYQRGLDYNETVAAADAQAQLGWQADLVFEQNGALSFTLANAEGAALEGAKVKAQFFRPTQDGQDFLVDLSPNTKGYSAEVKAAPGQWDVRIFVEWKQLRYQMTERIVVPQP